MGACDERCTRFVRPPLSTELPKIVGPLNDPGTGREPFWGPPERTTSVTVRTERGQREAPSAKVTDRPERARTADRDRVPRMGGVRAFRLPAGCPRLVSLWSAARNPLCRSVCAPSPASARPAVSLSPFGCCAARATAPMTSEFRCSAGRGAVRVRSSPRWAASGQELTVRSLVATASRCAATLYARRSLAHATIYFARTKSMSQGLYVSELMVRLPVQKVRLARRSAGSAWRTGP